MSRILGNRRLYYQLPEYAITHPVANSSSLTKDASSSAATVIISGAIYANIRMLNMMILHEHVTAYKQLRQAQAQGK